MSLKCRQCDRAFSWPAARASHERWHEKGSILAAAEPIKKLVAALTPEPPPPKPAPSKPPRPAPVSSRRIAPMGVVPDDAMLPEGEWALEIIAAEEVEHDARLAYAVQFASVAPEVGYHYVRTFLIGSNGDPLAFESKTWRAAPDARALKTLLGKAGYLVRAEVDMTDAMAFLVGKRLEVVARHVADADGVPVVHFEQVDPMGTNFDVPEVAGVLPPTPRRVEKPAHPLPATPVEHFSDIVRKRNVAQAMGDRPTNLAQAGNFICKFCGQEKEQKVRDIHLRNCEVAAGGG